MDVLVDCLECCVQEVLYQRGVYAQECFVVERHMDNVPVHCLNPKTCRSARGYIRSWIGSLGSYLSAGHIQTLSIALYSDGRAFEVHDLRFTGQFNVSDAATTRTLCEQASDLLRRVMLMRATMLQPPTGTKITYRLLASLASDADSRPLTSATSNRQWVCDDRTELDMRLGDADTEATPVRTVAVRQFRMAMVARQLPP
ncbi:HORMA domain-containing protein [Plasmodiophora brassicae]|nr:hypothetical protein PBRA_007140 [Plasmodiophora brassicae]